MLKIVYPICCGIDVHKTFVVACVASTNPKGVTTYQSKRFYTYTKSLRELSDWLVANNCKDVCMESTGKYWHPVYNILETSCRPVLVHPKYIKAIRGKKTNKKDAKWIADVFKTQTFKSRIVELVSGGQTSNITASLAVLYTEKAERLNIREKHALQDVLKLVDMEIKRIIYYVSLLDSNKSDVVSSYYFKKLSMAQTAEKHGISIATVKRTLTSAASKLAEIDNLITS